MVELRRTHDAWLSILCFNHEVKKPSSAGIATTDHELRVKICGETRKIWESTSGLGKKPLTELFFLIITLQDWGPVSYTQSQFKTPLKYRKKWSFLPQEWKARPLLQWKGGGQREGAELGWRGKGEPQRARLAPPASEARDILIPPAKLEAAVCMAF